MESDRNRTSVLRQLAALQKMSTEDLQEKWRDLYGNEPPKFSRTFIQKRLAYRIQELFYGGLSEETEKRLAEIVKRNSKGYPGRKNIDPENEPKGKKKILPGTRFVRIYNGVRYTVTASERGFVFRGRTFRSLSAVAREITGNSWNGREFFGLVKRKRKKS
jgi:hypothetical protein